MLLHFQYRKHSIIHRNYNESCNFFIDDLYQIKDVPTILTLLSFYHEWMPNFIKCFFYDYQNNHMISSLLFLLFWFITLFFPCQLTRTFPSLK